MASTSKQYEEAVELWRSRTYPAYPTEKFLYRLQKQLSHGPTTIVYKALCTPLQTTVAIKIINLDNLEKKYQMADEILNHYNLLPNHFNILKPHVIYVLGNKIYVVMPYMRSGSLQSLISHKFTTGLQLERIATYMLDISAALVEIHRAGLSHAGIKPGNILLSESGSALLSDYIVSSWYYDKEFWSEESNGSLSWWKSPLYWLPSEQFTAEGQFRDTSDIWSLGITALELFHGRPPISKFPNAADALFKISKRFQYADHLSKDRPIEKECPPCFKNFLVACFQGPYRRPNAAQLFTHEFITRAANPRLLEIGNSSMAPRMINFSSRLELGMSDIDERFNIRVRKTLTVDEPIVHYIPRRLISTWTFNPETLVLDPRYCMSIIDDLVRSDGATIKPDGNTLENETQEFRLSLISFILDTMLEELMWRYMLFLPPLCD